MTNRPTENPLPGEVVMTVEEVRAAGFTVSPQTESDASAKAHQLGVYRSGGLCRPSDVKEVSPWQPRSSS